MQIFSDVILNKLEQLSKDYKYLSELLTFEEILIDNKLCKKYQKQLDNIEPICNSYQNLLNLHQQLDIISSKTNFDSEQEAELFRQEKLDLSNKIKKLKTEIVKNLNKLNSTYQSITIEIIVGNEQYSQQLKNDIVLGYQNFFKQNLWQYQNKTQQEITIFNVTGLNTKKIMQNEIGLHTAKINNQQCSCKVFVFDSFVDTEPTFNEQDIKIEVCRSSGAGGQHINTTDSSIKITHIQTGITAVCQDERSQIQNKQKAFQNLKIKVLDFYNNQKLKFVKQQKTEQLKLIKQNHITKIYDYNNKIIKSKKDNQQIKFDDFLSGNVL